MPSPFPGMDPFIEGQAWEDFHHGLAEAIRDALTVRLRPKYVVRVERRVYVERHGDVERDLIRPDVAVTRRPSQKGAQLPSARANGGEPVILTSPMPVEERESFVVIRTRDGEEVVTIIEILSPGNKREGSDGQAEYLSKRASVLRSRTHLVEIDLLRGGTRLPTIEPLPRADYYAFLSRGDQRPSVEVYPWRLQSRLRTIPVPLTGRDPAVPLDLQALVNQVYDRAGYDYSLSYGRAVEPPLPRGEATWVRRVLRQQRRSQ